jgi:hypothetical protein
MAVYDKGSGGDGFAIYIPSLRRERDVLPERVAYDPADENCAGLALGTFLPVVTIDVAAMSNQSPRRECTVACLVSEAQHPPGAL